MREDISIILLPATRMEASASPGAASFYSFAKRGLDILITLLVAPVAILLVGILAVIVRADGHSAFYSQPRLGMAGRTFRIWKLRTMVPDAERKLKAYLNQNPAARAEWEPTQKLTSDPRVTAVGRYLRAYSLDELPQLWNVVKGDMSLVGPRPMLPEQLQSYPGREYFSLRPGLTGLWQVAVRNECSFVERASYDARYARTMSLSSDLKILLKTPIVMLRGTGL